MTTARERRELHERLVHTLGERAGDTAVGSEFASVRGEIGQLREDMAVQFGLQRREIAALVLSRRTIVLTVVATVAGLGAAIAASVAAVVALG